MQKNGLRVVHYLNQFFGGIGGEDKASVGPQAKEGAVGPGRAINEALGDRGEVVATVICGDDYFAERMEEGTNQVIELIVPHRPDVVLAGPAFDAGRYGIACGAVCSAVYKRLGIPAVTGMYKENPGVDLFRKDIYIVETGDSARRMAETVKTMVNLTCRLAAGQKIGKPSDEGYFPRGFLVNEVSDKPAAERVVSMLLAKLQEKPYDSEVPLPSYDRVARAVAIKDLSRATIALVTDGGLVPKGNPDKIEARAATKFGAYDITGVDALKPEEYGVSHSGYSVAFVEEDPHRLLPVDVLRDLEKDGVIGKLHETFYSTSGCASIVGNCKKMGEGIAAKLKSAGVSGVILTST